MELREIAIVGASLAGLRGAEALRRLGFDGRVHLIGREVHLPYDRPPLSKDVLLGKRAPEQTALATAAELDKLDLQLHLGRAAVALDLTQRHVELDGGGRLPFDGLMVATGGSPRWIPGTEALSGVHVLRTLDDCLAIRRALEARPRVVVVGAGFIGAEVASSCRAQGLEVTVVEALEVPLERILGREMGQVCASLHRDAGVALELGVGVAAIEGDGRVERVRLSDGRVIAADLVVVGIGVFPETRWLETSGLTLQDGVVCDETLLAGAPGVVAAGDVARWPNRLFDGESMRIEHWTNAVDQAEAAAKRLLAGDGPGEPFAPVPFFWSDQYGVKIQFAGRVRPSDEVHVVHGDVSEKRFVALYGRAGRLVGVLGFGRPRYVIQFQMMIEQRASLADAQAAARA